MFQTLLEKIVPIITGTQERNAKLLAVCQLLYDTVEHYNWVGFYIADNDRHELHLGPYAGEPTEHVRIPFGKGICGQAAATGKTFLIQDTSREQNYLSCSLKVQSEVVVPVFKNAVLVAELDIDSHAKAPFSALDRRFLEEVARLTAPLF